MTDSTTDDQRSGPRCVNGAPRTPDARGAPRPLTRRTKKSYTGPGGAANTSTRSDRTGKYIATPRRTRSAGPGESSACTDQQVVWSTAYGSKTNDTVIFRSSRQKPGGCHYAGQVSPADPPTRMRVGSGSQRNSAPQGSQGQDPISFGAAPHAAPRRPVTRDRGADDARTTRRQTPHSRHIGERGETPSAQSRAEELMDCECWHCMYLTAPWGESLEAGIERADDGLAVRALGRRPPDAPTGWGRISRATFPGDAAARQLCHLARITPQNESIPYNYQGCQAPISLE